MTALATLSPAQKAWATRRAALASTTVPVAPARKTRLRSVERVSFLAARPAEMTPAQKAAVSRKALAEVRARQQAVEAIAVQAVAEVANDTLVVDVWLDRPDVGCGWRQYVVIEKGPRQVVLFYAARLLTISIDRLTFEQSHRPAQKVRRKVVAANIAANLSRADRINDAAQAVVVADGGREAARALALLAA